MDIDTSHAYVLLLPLELVQCILQYLPPYSRFAYASLCYLTFCQLRDTVGLSRKQAFHAMGVSAEHGDITLLRWLLSLQLWPPLATLETCLSKAAEHGQLDMLAFLKTTCPQVSLECIHSSSIANVATFQWLDQNRETPYTASAKKHIFGSAVHGGKVDLALHLYQQSPTELTSSDWNSAAHSGCLQALLPLTHGLSPGYMNWLGSHIFYRERLFEVLQSDREVEKGALRLLFVEYRKKVDDQSYLIELPWLFHRALRTNCKDKFFELLKLHKEVGQTELPPNFFRDKVFSPAMISCHTGLLAAMRSDVELCRSFFRLLDGNQFIDIVKLFRLDIIESCRYVEQPVSQFILDSGCHVNRDSPDTAQLVSILCRFGQLDYLQWLYIKVSGLPVRHFLDVRACRCVKELPEHSAVVCALYAGHLPLLQWLDTTFGTGFVVKAAPTELEYSGTVSMWLHGQGHDFSFMAERLWRNEYTCLWHPSVSVLRWILQTFPDFKPDISVLELYHCTPEARSFLCDHFFPTLTQLLTDDSALLRDSLCRDRLDLLQWIHQRYKLTAAPFRKKFLTKAAKHGSLFVLRWLFLTFPSLGRWWASVEKCFSREHTRRYLEQFVSPAFKVNVLSQ